jgi:ferritin-like metal-binding protein YciE
MESDAPILEEHMPLDGPTELFIYELSAAYDGEQKMAELLGQATQQIHDNALVAILRAHLEETRQQAANLEQCFDLLAEEPRDVTCLAIDGVRQEYQNILAEQPDPDVLAMFLVDAATKAEHYEVGAYRGLVDKALLLGEAECALLLQTNLVQEEETTTRLERLNHDMSERALTEV